MNLPDKLLEFVRGDREAFAFLMDVHEIVEVWDDLIDKDKPVSDAVLNGTFYRALITLPRNGFYQRNFSLLNPVFEAAIMDWWTASRFESNREELETAYTLRCGFYMLTVMSARIIGGLEWAKEVGAEVRKMGDTLAEYSAQFGVK